MPHRRRIDGWQADIHLSIQKTSDDVSGRTVVNYRQGSVLDDSWKGKAILTLIL